MAEPLIHIDTDWKKQAQEEKRKLAEAEQKRASAPAPVAAAAPMSPGMRGAPAGAPRRGAREIPAASIGTLVQSLLTQSLFYMGDLGMQGTEPVINLDMAKHQIDTLTVLEEKTHGNLTPEERLLLDGALYESRMRFVSVASEYL